MSIKRRSFETFSNFRWLLGLLLLKRSDMTVLSGCRVQRCTRAYLRERERVSVRERERERASERERERDRERERERERESERERERVNHRLTEPCSHSCLLFLSFFLPAVENDNNNNNNPKTVNLVHKIKLITVQWNLIHSLSRD